MGAQYTPIPSDTRPMRVSKQEGLVVNHGTTAQLLNVASCAGTVTMIQLAIIPQGSDDTMMKTSQLRFYFNGEVTPSEVVSLQAFYMLFGYAVPRTTWIGNGSGCGPTLLGVYRFLEIPFANGIVIEFINNSSSNYADIFTQVTWRAGVNPLMGNRQHWHVHELSGVSVPHYVPTDLLPAVASAGEIETIMQCVNSSANYAYFEGNIALILDGAAQTWGGTEDFYGGQSYFDSGGGGFAQPQFGGAFNLGLGTFDSRVYNRIPDTYTACFNSNGQVSWPNGQVGEASDPGTVTLSSLVTYWTASPLPSWSAFPFLSSINGDIGNIHSGDQLLANNGTATVGATFTYQWKKTTAGVVTNLVTTQEYDTVAGDIGAYVCCVVTATLNGASRSWQTPSLIVNP